MSWQEIYFANVQGSLQRYGEPGDLSPDDESVAVRAYWDAIPCTAAAAAIAAERALRRIAGDMLGS